ncbi:MAG TPA: serine/threonine-protein kinase [Terriglobia bacterium]|jgi:serine/threonine-protein kinase
MPLLEMKRYKLERELGQGTAGIVYKALDTLTEQIVAVKVFHDFLGVPVRELEIARRIRHPNVCCVHEYHEEDGVKLLSMEYIDGLTLAERLPEGALSRSEILTIAGEFLDGLEAIHKMGSMHLDLKPGNLMLTRDGHVKILDFGQARRIDPDDYETGNAPGGTPAYRAPELSTGAPRDPRADIYSFGVIFAEMLCGEHPRPPVPIDFPADVRGEVRSTIECCVEMDRNKRFNSVADVRNAAALNAPQLQPSRGRTAFLAAAAAALILIAIYFFSSVGAVKNAATSGQGTKTVVKREQKTIDRVAVLNFHNLSGDAALESYTAGIAETITAELAQVSGLIVVDRDRVLSAAHDIDIPKLDIIPAANAAEIGKAIGVDALITGSIQKSGTDVRLIGRIIDSATGQVFGSTPAIDGAFQDLFKLQADLAGQLVALIHGTPVERSQKAPRDAHSSEAFQAFSSGVYYLEHDLPADALKAFDRTLAIDRQYPAANHYRGLTLAKLNRLDDASDAFKRALPQSKAEEDRHLELASGLFQLRQRHCPRQ